MRKALVMVLVMAIGLLFVVVTAKALYTADVYIFVEVLGAAQGFLIMAVAFHFSKR